MTNSKIYEGKAIDGPLHGKWIRSRAKEYVVYLQPQQHRVTYVLWEDGIWRLFEYDDINIYVWWRTYANGTEYTEPNKL